jgi:hypothetical protein
VLDLFGRSQERTAEGLQPVADALAHIAEVLGLLRENLLGERLRGQVALISRTIRENARVAESLLMDVAESVLSIESALSDWGAIAPMEKADDVDQNTSGAVTPEAEAEHRRVIRQVMNEAKHDLVKAREAINMYVQKPGEKALIAEAPRLLRQISGSLVMLSYRRVAQVLKACQRFVEHDLAGSQTLPPGENMDALADAMMSVEYYLEAFVESRVHPSSVLDVAERAVAKMAIRSIVSSTMCCRSPRRPKRVRPPLRLTKSSNWVWKRKRFLRRSRRFPTGAPNRRKRRQPPPQRPHPGRMMKSSPSSLKKRKTSFGRSTSCCPAGSATIPTKRPCASCVVPSTR